MQQKSLTRSLLKTIIITAGIALLSIIALLGYFMSQTPSDPYKDHSLGDGLEYIGSTQSGCSTFCDSRPIFEYYYATDMNQSEIAAYFKKATLNSSRKDSYSTSLSFQQKTGGRQFSLDYYTTENTPKYSFIKKDKNTVSINSLHLQTAKDSL